MSTDNTPEGLPYVLGCGHTVNVPHGGSARCEPCSALADYLGGQVARSKAAEHPATPAEVETGVAGLSQALREIGPAPGGVMEPNRIAAKLLDHEWFKQTVARRQADANRWDGLSADSVTPPSEPDAGDVGGLGELLRDMRLSVCGHSADSLDEYVCSPCLRDRLLTSNWLATRTRMAADAGEKRGAERALREAADQLDRDGMKRLGAHTVKQWLRARADQEADR